MTRVLPLVVLFLAHLGAADDDYQFWDACAAGDDVVVRELLASDGAEGSLWAQSELNQMKWDHLTELTPWTGPPPLTAASAAAAAAGTGDIAQLRSEVAALRRDDANVKAQLGAIQAGLAALQEQFRPLLQSKGARLRRLARV